MSITETWKDIAGFEGLYRISSQGRVLSLSRTVKAPMGGGVIYKKDQYLKPKKRGATGYLGVCLANDGINRDFYVHRLVALAFHENPKNKKEINHIDGKKDNNCVSNIEWCTRSENAQHAVDNNLLKSLLHPRRKVAQYSLAMEFIREWKSLGEIKRVIGVEHSGIRNCCLGKCGNSKGFIWRFVD